MPQLIKDRALADDRWMLLREAASLTDLSAGRAVIVPLALWKAERAALVARGDVGVWLSPSDDPAELASDIAALQLIAVDFPKFTDGRGYSTARLLRDRYGCAISSSRWRSAASMHLRCAKTATRPRHWPRSTILPASTRRRPRRRSRGSGGAPQRPRLPLPAANSGAGSRTSWTRWVQ